MNWVRLFIFHFGLVLNFEVSTTIVLTSILPTPLATSGPPLSHPGSVFQLLWSLFVKGSKTVNFPFLMLVSLSLCGLSVPTLPLRLHWLCWVRALRAHVFGEMQPFVTGCSPFHHHTLSCQTLLLGSFKEQPGFVTKICEKLCIRYPLHNHLYHPSLNWYLLSTLHILSHLILSVILEGMANVL